MSARSVPLFHIDAFAHTAFAGNPAGVCLLPEPYAEGWMQQMAQELHLPATAFLSPHPGGPQDFYVRWFTPSSELELCGHATLASAHVLWEVGRVAYDEPLHFHTQSGVLHARWADSWIELDLPARPPSPIDEPSDLAAALGAVLVRVSTYQSVLLVELTSEEAVRTLRPDFVRLRSLPMRGVIVTSEAASPSSADYDIVSRYFAPAVGIDEDPVTGSAHCCLAPYWTARLGRAQLVAYQASTRGGTVRIRMEGNQSPWVGRLSHCCVERFLAVSNHSPTPPC